MNMIEIKDISVVESLLTYEYHRKLVILVSWIIKGYGRLIFTSGFRLNDPGVHGQIPCRGIDIRSYVYKKPEELITEVNKHWIYDKSRPEKVCALLHDVGLGRHIHLQVSDKTEYVSG